MTKCAICEGEAGTVLDTSIDDEPVCNECRWEAERSAKSEVGFGQSFIPRMLEILRYWLSVN